MDTFIIILIIALMVGTFGFKLWLSILNYKNRTTPIPEIINDIYDEEEYSKWLKYSMENYRLALIESVFNMILSLTLLLSGLFIVFKDISEDLTETKSLQILIFIGIYFLISFFFDIFFSYYSKFSIEERYGFNKSTKKTFILDKIKGLVLTIVFGGGLIHLLFTLYDSSENWFFITAWVSLVAIMLFVNMFYVKLIVPIFNKLRPLEEGELKDKINAFGNKVGYEVTKISVIDASKRSTKLNAYFSGLGKMKQVVLYDTLIEKMSPDQIVAVLAHEIGHSKHKHIYSGIIQASIMISINLAVLLFTLKSPDLSTAFGFDDAHFGFGLIIFGVLLSPISIILEAITSGISRKHEYQADKYAVDHGFKVPMMNALKILSKENFSNLTPHPLYVKLTYSHPPVADRLIAIEKIKG
jgi:STE24 endopeptidase